MKIKVCIPYYLEYEACKSGLKELMTCTEHDFVVTTVKSTYIGEARNFMVNDGLSTKRKQHPVNGYDSFLFIDSDINFTLADILSLIEMDKPIVSLPYETFNGSGLYQVGQWGKILGDLGSKYNVGASGVRIVSWIGCGMHLVKREVYSQLEFPWYRHTMIANGEHQVETGEDIGFCIEAKKRKIDIYCNFNNPVNHTKKG